MLGWLDWFPLAQRVIATVLRGLAPLLPEPHAWGKLRMLAHGTPRRPGDVLELPQLAASTAALGWKRVCPRQAKG
ncbi:MAG: RND transporter [Burkholderiales bacterium]|jgi:hypothetical protein|nr:RND transporter [Burkholderiales bacterium]